MPRTENFDDQPPPIGELPNHVFHTDREREPLFDSNPEREPEPLQWDTQPKTVDPVTSEQDFVQTASAATTPKASWWSSPMLRYFAGVVAITVIVVALFAIFTRDSGDSAGEETLPGGNMVDITRVEADNPTNSQGVPLINSVFVACETEGENVFDEAAFATIVDQYQVSPVLEIDVLTGTSDATESGGEILSPATSYVTISLTVDDSQTFTDDEYVVEFVSPIYSAADAHC